MAKKILVVDDEARIRSQVRELLLQEGYQPLEAADGVEALAILGREDVDLLLTDLMMPRLDGGDLAMIIRGRRRDSEKEDDAQRYFSGDRATYDALVGKYQSVPLVMMSSTKDGVLQRAADRFGAGFFQKPSISSGLPLNASSLLQVIREYLPKP